MVSSFWKEFLETRASEYLSYSTETSPGQSDIDYDFCGKITNKEWPLSYSLYKNDTLYQKILQIPEPTHGSPPKTFKTDYQTVSGNFLRQAYFAYKILTSVKKHPKTIVEFGGGYGLLAYMLRILFPESKIFIIDIPEIISLQHNFLSQIKNESIGHISLGEESDNNSPDEYEFNINLVECSAASSFKVPTDLAIALASFQEMNKDTVNSYLDWIQNNINESGYFYGYNCNGQDIDGYISPADMPWDEKWTISNVEQSTHVQDNFRHLEIFLKRQAQENKQWHSQQEKLRHFYNHLQDRNLESLTRMRSELME